MKLEAVGPLGVRRLGAGEAGGPAVLLCHGFGAPGDDLVSLARVIDAGRGVRWFFPEAPLSLDFGLGIPGRAWWPIDMVRVQRAMQGGQAHLLADETPLGLAPAREKLEGCIGELEKSHGVVREKLIVGGFSQGAMLATEVALHAARPFAGLAVLSGALVSRDWWETAAQEMGPRTHVLMTHGRSDMVLPFAGGEALRALFEKTGARVTWVPHAGGHEIPPAALDAFAAFARARFA